MVVCCSSPERFLRVSEAGLVESKPIKGTVARSADPVLDARAAASLASSQKERAENLMIVDLIRNDLGRVCVAGSIGVPLLMAIESYTSVDGGHFCDTFTRQAVGGGHSALFSCTGSV
jgi:para-aminobenzoate synthetase